MKKPILSGNEWCKMDIPKTPYRCPICEGRGIVAGNFYNSTGVTGTAAELVTQCRACNGTGIIYSPQTPSESQDKLWNQLLDSIPEVCLLAPISEPDRRKFINQELKSQFTITRKS